MKIVFWSPSAEGRTTQNMKVLANVLRIRYGMQVYTFQNYKKISIYPGLEEKGLIFIDCKNHKNSEVSLLLKYADAVVVNFPQKEAVLREYFFHKPLILGNIFYLIGSSTADPARSEKMCKEIFRLKEEESGTMPYHAQMEEKYHAKKGFSWQRELLNRENYGADETFVKKTCEIAVKLIKMNCLFG